jgi:hypothetical protein
MNKYYKIISLEKGKTLLVKNNKLEVDLKNINTCKIINNDEVFKENIKPDFYFWVSGGGSFFINKKYIFLVKRSSDSKINPDKFSIFTGRADSIAEIINPLLLVRELFEELLITRDGFICYPRCPEFQSIINNVYKELKKNFFKERNIKYLNFDLKYLPFLNKKIVLTTESGKKEICLDYYINNNNDINVLFLFSGVLDISNLGAFDGEHYKSKNAIFRHSREIYLYDIFSSSGRNISDGENNELVNIPENDLTEHCKYFINNIKNENNY